MDAGALDYVFFALTPKLLLEKSTCAPAFKKVPPPPPTSLTLWILDILKTKH